MKLSQLSETLKGSEIVKLAGEIREKMMKGEKIYNFTIGDFDPNIFPIPDSLKEGIIQSYKNNYTNYPAADGELELRKAVAQFIRSGENLEYNTNEILIAAGGRPLIYTLYRAIVDKGEKVIYAVPSWNNNHYVHFAEGEHCLIQTTPEDNFMPTVESIAPHIKGATLLALCSPQNPTGTTFSREVLTGICDLVLEENKRRGEGEKKLYIMFDQMYWTLTYGDTVHHNPVSLRPELKEYTIFVDGVSKAFAATGVRVGWAMGPAPVIAKMKAILSHIGAWSPMAEQKATAAFLMETEKVEEYLKQFRLELEERLVRIYKGLKDLKNEGFAIDAIPPQAAIYLTVKLDLCGKTTKDGRKLETQADVTTYLLDEAKLAVVPFYCFGGSVDSPWYRLSVGTCKKEEIDEMLGQLKNALTGLS